MATNQVPGYMPTHYGGDSIKFRVPYTFAAELIVPAATAAPANLGVDFPAATFEQRIEIPFEIWDMQLDASQLNDNGVPIAAPAPGIDKFWRVRIQDTSKNQQMTKNQSLVQTIKDRNTGTWFWRYPYTIVRAEGFDIAVDNLLPANRLRAEIAFRGFLIFTKPASNTR